ncbi:hypothetical protein CFC21_041051 [Triticum aestivum]|uniref:Uncharacterized protein n=3 Tax=Triticum TaxID=4564 RepID=A0A9R1FJ41_WHEAT|nr:hypothetical protein CFC21_041051 [Triticum aestivum]CDM82718.1 unnamed protein product [Triticum aestivum]VAH75955.1 unnamed protein product [Triticum turgidum subsp. durum]
MAIGHLRAFLVFLLVQVWLFLMMVASAKVQGRPVGVASVPACCTYHVECCQRLTAEAPIAATALP